MGADAARKSESWIDNVRADFPFLQRQIQGRPIAYLDNAASAQKPEQVISALTGCYQSRYANVHRGVHTLSVEATEDYERAREQVRDFIGAAETAEIVYTRGTTEAINLVAQSYGSRLGPWDEILITQMEHHSNIVPWQLLCQRTGARLRYIPIDDDGALMMDRCRDLINARTRVVAVSHVSNALGTINDLHDLIERAHRVGAVFLVDGAQAVPHMNVNVRELDCDFYAFSGHKLYAPTGIGVLYGRRSLLEEMPPWQGGGDMILSVSMEGSSYNELPYKFEAGTPSIGDAVGLGAAIDYVRALDQQQWADHEEDLLRYGTQELKKLPGVRIIGTTPHKCSILSFVIDGLHAHDVGTILDTDGVAVRVGHHCSMPVMEHFNVPATVRASFAMYNTRDEIDRLVIGIKKAVDLLQ